MSDPKTEPAPAPNDPVGWRRFHGKLVLLQLAVPYGAVRYPNVPIRARDVNPNVPPEQADGFAYTETLPGVLYVEADAHGLLLLIEIQAPPDGKDKATIAIHPEDVRFCTMVERSLIERG